MFTSRRGAPSWRMIAVAATGSVGETIAPSAKASGHEKPDHLVRDHGDGPDRQRAPGRSTPSRSRAGRCAARAGPRRRRPRTAVAAGRSRAPDPGSSSISGMPGIRPSTSPPSTSGIGYGTDSQRAIAFRPATDTNSAARTISKSSTAELSPAACPSGQPRRPDLTRVFESHRLPVDPPATAPTACATSRAPTVSISRRLQAAVAAMSLREAEARRPHRSRSRSWTSSSCHRTRR